MVSQVGGGRDAIGSYILRMNQVLFLDIISAMILLKMVDSTRHVSISLELSVAESAYKPLSPPSRETRLRSTIGLGVGPDARPSLFQYKATRTRTHIRHRHGDLGRYRSLAA